MANRFIQGKLPPGNFELVTRVGAILPHTNSKLVHLWRDQHNKWQPSTNPAKGEVISPAADSPGAIIQDKTCTTTNPGDFHVLVLEGTNLVHYTKDNSKISNPWIHADPFIVSSRATGEASFIQGNLGASKNNFEAVVLEGSNLVHYYKDNSTPGNQWVETYTISTSASSAGCLIQSNLGAPGSPGNLEVVVLEGNNLVHYYRDNSNLTAPSASLWSPKPTAIISTQAQSSASFIQVNLHLGPHSGDDSPGPGNFELVVLENGAFVQYSRDNSQAPTYPWSPNPPATIATTSEFGQACLIQSQKSGQPDPLDVVLLAGNHGDSILAQYSRESASNPTGAWKLEGVAAQFQLDSINDG